ncbi:hypothetical protein FAUST_11286 [Fusarium austroamericanum]|uniref:Uncharacterized protein n=1 Tax=Fusarium austroamericanum TaxID=282268 RepID=A0AAN5Z1M5_FUSAU|nr:hypothetical protein FAUST_11286 [Fusarium austroamericanum]
MLLEEEDVRQSVARGELAEVRGMAFHNRTWIINHRFCSVGDGVDTLEGYVHTIWHTYYLLSRHAACESFDHDRLVLDILRIQGLGVLTRPASGLYGVDVARTADGLLWTDLPFLVTDMTKFWVDNCATLSGHERHNFASFLAKLASTRVSRDKLCQIALITLRSTFEDDRRDLGSVNESDEEDQKREMKDLTIAQLLPSALVWMKEAGHMLVELSDKFWSDCSSSAGKGGTLFVQSELGNRCPNGFTPWRWMFWLKRLHEICDQAKEADETCLKEYADDAIEQMVKKVEERNSEILRAYKDDSQDGSHLSCLRPLVKGLGRHDNDT